MRCPDILTLQAVCVCVSVCVSVCVAMQQYPAAWSHYDVCKSRIYTEEGLTWDYMACQPEATVMTKYLTVSLDPPNITCGDPPETYCTLENPYMCNNECDASTDELAHPPELMFDFEGRNPTTFWQSSSWNTFPKPLEVNITLSWNKTIELTDDIILTFESGRPEQMLLEKSLDYGKTWTPYQFYATDCLDAFTMEPKTVNELTQRTLLDIICTEDYSRGYVWKYDKTVRFEIKDRFALFAGPRLHNMASLYGQLDTTRNLRDFFTVTDLRIRLLKPATGATMVDENNLSRYFYAISDIKVQGRCKCNLHSNSCVFDKDKGKLGCECEHNTTGPDCGRCKRHYHGRPWSVGSYLPIPRGTANICIHRSHGPVHRANASSLGVANRNQAHVCDNAMLLCQNGGTCHHHQRCHCAPGFKGVLCERTRCQVLGPCEEYPTDGQPSLHHPLLMFPPGLLLSLLLPLVVIWFC
ncbi:netrin-G1-like isoform X3 [Oncorhynchus keta]|uniref:netrin-G1-like isoform X3 n=1 Tax=Oncorhynchus keta TaxID=8018 RepID=UPI00227A407A|nr:netrin-G1-like isoform X3 [Oncorhynchus keta]XP_052331945.1 netrin-G1-like isoform X3 [Oncorhynchus keta]XP_052331946.1 netrin-G1-like isoform X3 [Oncorhynchus keta]